MFGKKLDPQPLDADFIDAARKEAAEIKRDVSKVVGLDMERLHTTLGDILSMAETKVDEIEKEIDRLTTALKDAVVAKDAAKLHFDALEAHLSGNPVKLPRAVHKNIQVGGDK